MEKNHEKEARYVALKGNLSRAIRNKFWFEACMIEYAIIEDRTYSILYYAKVAKNESKMLKTKLNSINNQIGKNHPVIAKKVDSDLIDGIDKWREKRNRMVHRAKRLAAGLDNQNN